MSSAKDVMKKKFKVLYASDSMQQACSVIIKGKISGAPVIAKNGKLIGFLSEKDIIKYLSKSKVAKCKVSDIMVKRVKFVDIGESLSKIAKVFTLKPYRRLPVTSDGKLVGIINRVDVMDTLLSEHY